MEWTQTLLLIYLAAINLITFLLYGMDKSRARRQAWRISEKTLLLTALIGGSLGAFLGMRIFRHKTKHLQFMILVPLFLVLHVALLVWIFF